MHSEAFNAFEILYYIHLFKVCDSKCTNPKWLLFTFDEDRAFAHFILIKCNNYYSCILPSDARLLHAVSMKTSYHTVQNTESRKLTMHEVRYVYVGNLSIVMQFVRVCFMETSLHGFLNAIAVVHCVWYSAKKHFNVAETKWLDLTI